jgi:hypothetical protein
MGRPIEIRRLEHSATALRELAGRPRDRAVVRRLLGIALTTVRRVWPHFIIVRCQAASTARACRNEVNSVSFRHSSRSRPMKLSANAFCCGLPGAM